MRNVVFIEKGTAWKLTCAEGKNTNRKELKTLTLSQEETNTRVILHCLYGQKHGYKYVRIKSPDANVLFTLFISLCS
jgi:hypothetical protein